MAYKRARVEAGRPVRMLLQTFRQETMGTWTRVAAVGGEKWSDSRYSLKIELTGFSDGV